MSENIAKSFRKATFLTHIVTFTQCVKTNEQISVSYVHETQQELGTETF